MKKISMLLVAIISTLLLATPIFATKEVVQVSGNTEYSEQIEKDEIELHPTVEHLTTRDEKVAYYTEVLGDATNGTVLYYLYEVQKYSLPICFVVLVVASLNFFIIGNKKLDKREQGFGMLVACGLGLIVFQVLPLLFAILTAGRIVF